LKLQALAPADYLAGDEVIDLSHSAQEVVDMLEQLGIKSEQVEP
jgi:hypothetical protein